jgi:hypothetical protein
MEPMEMRLTGLQSALASQVESVGIAEDQIWALKCRSPHALMRAAIVLLAPWRLDILMAIQGAPSLVGGEGQQHIEGVIVGAIDV